MEWWEMERTKSWSRVCGESWSNVSLDCALKILYANMHPDSFLCCSHLIPLYLFSLASFQFNVFARGRAHTHIYIKKSKCRRVRVRGVVWLKENKGVMCE